MTSLRLYLAIGCALFAGANLQAQNHFKLLFKGTCEQTNRTGQVVVKAVSERTWLKQFAEDHGITNWKSLAVSYHMTASELGDQIEVINPKTGEVHGSIFGLFFSEAFGRTGLTNATGTQTKTLQYLYTSQDSHSLGAAVVTKTWPSGNRKYPRMQGLMQYQILPNTNRTSVQICSGTFVTGDPFPFQTRPK